MDHGIPGVAGPRMMQIHHVGEFSHVICGDTFACLGLVRAHEKCHTFLNWRGIFWPVTLEARTTSARTSSADKPSVVSDVR